LPSGTECDKYIGRMSVNVTEIERGDILHIDGDPWQVSEVQSQTPSARGASMMVKARLRNLRTGQNLSRSWRGGETVATAEVDTLGVQYLYGQGDDHVFMDLQSFEQITLGSAQMGEARSFLLENQELKALVFEGRVIALELPMMVDLRVVDTVPSLKGATAQAQLKPATVETGLQVMVPSYIEPGERIRVDTRDGHFVERAR
jgi:elongation factor P